MENYKEILIEIEFKTDGYSHEIECEEIDSLDLESTSIEREEKRNARRMHIDYREG